MDTYLNQDHALLILIRENDDHAFKRLFLKYYPNLTSYATAFLKNSAEAEEAVSDVFFRLWQGRANLDPHMNVRAYLFTSVRNQALNYLRSRIKEQASLEEAAAHSGVSLEDDMQYREYEQQLNAIIEAMPLRQREVFRLSRFHGLTYDEIAATLSISAHTVQEYMINALKHLRKAIKDQRLLE